MVIGAIAKVSVLVPSPVTDVVVSPVRLLRSPAAIGSLKTTWIPVICQGRSNRDEPIRLYDREPKSTRYSTTVGAIPSITRLLFAPSDPAAGGVSLAGLGELPVVSLIVPVSAEVEV